ncbi:MAG: ACT domain-containing protein, partial [Verrucomicrobiota bacterium]
MKTTEPGTAGLRLVATCPDRIGIVARATTFLADRGASITEADQYHDVSNGMFFMRYAFNIPDGDGCAAQKLREDFSPLAEEFKMDWRLVDASTRRRVVLLVSKFDHCLAYL